MKPFQAPPEIEPLPDLAWRRVEEGVHAHLDLEGTRESARESRRLLGSRRWAWGLGVATAAALALVVWRTSGESDHQGVASRVVTADSPSEIAIGDADLVVDRESAVWISQAGGQVEVVLERGRADFSIAPRKGRPPFVVRAGQVRIEVVGTAFAVARDGGAAVVEVREGIVKVVHAGETTRVGAGDRWPPVADPSDELEMPPVSINSKNRKRSRDRRQGERLGELKGRQREAAAAPQSEGDLETADARSLYESAAALETSEPVAAIALYGQVAAVSGPWAAPALYAQGRLELERGQTSRARSLLEKYLQRFPRGQNAADAKDLLERLK